MNPEILQYESLVREFEKTRITEREKGFQVSVMIDGSRILTDSDHVRNGFGKITAELKRLVWTHRK